MEVETTGSETNADADSGEKTQPPSSPVPIYGLSFMMLRDRGVSRSLRWHKDGLSSWNLSEWAVAAVGELGEACNVIKKLNRLRDGIVGNKEGEDASDLQRRLADELADAVLYIDLLAAAADIDLELAVIHKFNAVSAIHNFPERLQYERLSHGYDR